MEKIVEWYESVRWGRALAAFTKWLVYGAILGLFVACAPLDKPWVDMTGADILGLALPIAWAMFWWSRA